MDPFVLSIDDQVIVAAGANSWWFCPRFYDFQLGLEDL